MLKLYQTNLSPFPTRVRLMLRVKGVAAEMIEPPGIHDSSPKGDYLEVNPIGRVPALQLEDGRVLPESEVICEYLEQVYPDPPMLPADPYGRARVRLLSRISDIYIVMAMLPLFNMVALPPAEWDQEAIAAHLAEIDSAFALLEEYIGDAGYAYGQSLTMADGTLVPIVLLAAEWLPIFRGPDLMARHPRTAAYWAAIQSDPHCAVVIEETRAALRKAMGRG